MDVEHPHEYDPERDGELLTPDEVCSLLHVSRSHLVNLRKNGTLRGWQQFPGSWWRYPSRQPTLVEARAALRGSAVTR
jgi:excisionase family DNA binding protein